MFKFQNVCAIVYEWALEQKCFSLFFSVQLLMNGLVKNLTASDKCLTVIYGQAFAQKVLQFRCSIIYERALQQKSLF